MDEMTIEIKGIEQVTETNRKIAQEIAESGNLVAKAALVIERQAKMNWGHGTHQGGFPNVQTGRLRASITIQIQSPIKAVVGTNVKYAPHVEYGMQLSKFKRRAYPFLGPTINQTKDQISGVMVSFGEDIQEMWTE